MLEFYIACGLLFLGLGWVAWHKLTHPEAQELDRVTNLERRVEDIEKRLKVQA